MDSCDVNNNLNTIFDVNTDTDKYASYYQQIYHQIDSINKFRTSMDISRKEKVSLQF